MTDEAVTLADEPTESPGVVRLLMEPASLRSDLHYRPPPSPTARDTGWTGGSSVGSRPIGRFIEAISAPSTISLTSSTIQACNSEPVLADGGSWQHNQSDNHTKGEIIMPKKSLTVGIVIGLAVCAGVVSGTRAFQTTGEAIAIDSDDLAGTVTGPSGPEAGVWVIAETTRPAHAVREDCRHRRSRTIPGARPAQGQLQRLGPRIRAGGLAEDPDDSRQEPRSSTPCRRALRPRRRSTIRPRTGCR